jgi:hypothetical protein
MVSGMDRRMLVLLVVAFIATRIVGAWLADHPATYGADAVGDVANYERKAQVIVDEGWAPYSNVPVEYPPGSLPFILAPHVVAEDLSYRVNYIALMLLVDVFGFIGICRIAARWGSSLGAWLWVLLVPLLGPIVYLRLDLIPAVATIWALERASVGGAFGTGAWLSFGTIAKLYPALLFVPALWTMRRRGLLLAGAAATVVPLAALGGSIDDVGRTVLGYHAERGIQVESTWASGLLLAMRRGGESVIRFDFGAFHVEGGGAETLKTIASLVAAAALIAVTWMVVRRSSREDTKMLAASSFTIVLTMVATGLVFSPQFLVWLFALAAVALAVTDSPVRWPALMLLPIALLTQWIFPFHYEQLLDLEALPVFVLICRNLMVLSATALALWGIYRRPAVPAERGDELEARHLATG